MLEGGRGGGGGSHRVCSKSAVVIKHNELLIKQEKAINQAAILTI